MISIVTVCYNNLNELKKTISSVLEQNCDEYELIIVDGGSDSSLLRYLSSVVNDNVDKKIKYISEPDDGPYDAMNKGLTMVNGTHVIFMNSGDTFHDVSDIESYLFYVDDFDVIYGDFHANDNGRLRYRKSKPVSYYRSDFKEMGFCHQSVAVSSVLFSSQDSSNMPFSPSYKIAADLNFMYPILKDVNIRKKYLGRSTSNFSIGGLSDSKRLSSIFEHISIYKKHNAITSRALITWLFIILQEVIKSPIRKLVRKI